MSTEFINDQWRLPNNENKDKQSNYSMDFDSASSDYINVGNDVSLQFSSSFSISAWVKIDLNDTTTNAIISKDSNSSNGSGYHIDFRSGNQVHAWSYISSSKLIATGLTTNTWYHIVFVFESTGASNGNQSLYINAGTPVTNTITNFAASTVKHLRIGGSEVLSGYTNGQIDAVSIYNYALSSSQVTTLYGSSSTGIGNPMSLSPKPVAYYPLGDQDAFNGANYLVPNSSLKDYVFDFDGSSNEKITTSNSSLINGESAASFSLWIKGKTGLASYDGMLCFRSGSDYILIIARGTITSTEFPVWIQQSGGGVTSSTSNAIVSLNEWNHIVVSGAVGGKWNIYVNGELSTTQSQSSNNIAAISQASSFIIGQDISSREFVGEMSNIQIFNTELPATGSNSVETLYNNGSPLTSMTGFTSLVSWWKLDASDTYDSSTANWTIEDHAGSNDGTSSGMTQANLVQSDLSFTSGYSPYALDFDGTNDYIDIVNSSTAPTSLQSLGNSNSYSISSWINTTTTDTYSALWFAGKTILEMRNEGTTGIHVPFNLSVSSGKLFFGRSSNYTTSSENYSSTTSVNTGFWVHCITTVDNNTLKLYINGSLDSTHTFTSATGDCSVGSNTSNFFIGSRSTDGGGNDAYMDGSISNCSIWNTELTSAQVKEIYSEGVPQNLLNHSAVSSLVSWWQLGSNSSFNTNWTVLDEVTASGNNGTSSNMTEASIVDGVGSYANGVSSGMSDNIVGDAFGSSANSLSVNMDVLDRTEDTPA